MKYHLYFERPNFFCIFIHRCMSTFNFNEILTYIAIYMLENITDFGQQGNKTNTGHKIIRMIVLHVDQKYVFRKFAELQ